MEIKVKKLYTGSTVKDKVILSIENGQISQINEFEGGEFDYETLAPALVDIHINGGEKFHFTAKPTFETLEDISVSAKKNGTGYVLPALITSSPENIFKAIDVTKSYVQKDAGVLGLHLEGPFISVAKRGAHLTKYIRKPDDVLLREIIERAEGIVKMMTIAPEHFTNTQIKMLLDSGIKVSLGHSNCTYKRAMEVFDLGVNLVTHLFNAMSSFHHRSPGLTGAALAHQEVYTPVIVDGVHADYDAVMLAQKLKGDKLFFISDALFQNHVKTEFKWDEFDAKLIDGNYINTDGNLAGATISMADCVKNGVDQLKLSLDKAIEKSTRIPADVLGLKVGKIEIGYPARFCVPSDNFKLIAF